MSDSTVDNAYTLTPSPSPVTTAITAYFQEPPIDPNYEQSPYETSTSIVAYPPNVINGLPLNSSYGYFVLNPSPLDGFNTRFSSSGPQVGYITTDVIVPLTNSIRNYIAMHRIIVDSPYPASTGFQNDAVIFDPTAANFGSMLPSPIFDSIGQRWFLCSFGGAFTIVTRTSESSQYSALQVPIASAIVNNAPDTIGSWWFNYTSFLWERTGTAIKIGTTYQKRFFQAGVWTMATPIPGKYLTLHLRADDSSTITATRVILTGNNITVAEGMTDADGNMVCFVPIGWPLSITAYETPVQNSEIVYSAKLPENAGRDVTMVVERAFNPNLTTIHGIVYNCDGSLLSNGILTLGYTPNNKTDLYIPIKDGRFTTSLWEYRSLLNTEITDLNGNVLGDAGMLGFPDAGNSYTFTLSSCPNSTLLYANEMVDDLAATSMVDDAAAASPYLTADLEPGFWTRTNAVKNGKGFQFTADYSSTNVDDVTVKDLSIDGVSYTVDNSQTHHVICWRYDGNTNGIIEGSASIYYVDASQISHHLSANFKVRKNF